MISMFKLISWGYLHGFSNLLRKLKYKIKIKNLKNIKKEAITNTSLTDSSLYIGYPSFCATAAGDEKVFSEFRSYKEIIDVLDHVTVEQARKYLEEIERYSNWNTDFTLALNHIDSLGKPFSYKFNQGIFSPTSIRYLKTFLEIRYLFGDLKDYNIIEIGVGFGGQAAIFQLLSNPKSYSLYDLMSTLNLARNFLGQLNLDANIISYDGTNPQPGINSPDLIISNYAFSELNREIQDKYLENIILKSPKGYITWNCLSHEKLNGYSLADLVRIIPKAEIIPEVPNTHLSNAIIIWK